MFEHKPNHLEDELCFSIYTAQRFYNRFYTEALKKYNLTYAQYITLLVLWESKEKMIIRDLGLRLKLDTGTLTPLLKRMEKEGWVTRTKTKADGRKVYITLTDKALELEDGSRTVSLVALLQPICPVTSIKMPSNLSKTSLRN